MAANKSDLFANEAVSEEKARNFAKEIGAVFKLTSACTSAGVEKLFYNVGCKYLDPNFKDNDDGNNANSNNTNEEKKVEAAPVQKTEKTENSNNVKEEKKEKPKESENKGQKKGIKLDKANTKPKKKKKFC